MNRIGEDSLGYKLWEEVEEFGTARLGAKLGHRLWCRRSPKINGRRYLRYHIVGSSLEYRIYRRLGGG
jgi:hypothetical protein